MVGLQLKIPVKWMIWGYPYFTKPTYVVLTHDWNPYQETSFDRSTGLMADARQTMTNLWIFKRGNPLCPSKGTRQYIDIIGLLFFYWLVQGKEGCSIFTRISRQMMGYHSSPPKKSPRSSWGSQDPHDKNHYSAFKMRREKSAKSAWILCKIWGFPEIGVPWMGFSNRNTMAILKGAPMEPPPPSSCSNQLLNSWTMLDTWKGGHHMQHGKSTIVLGTLRARSRHIWNIPS